MEIDNTKIEWLGHSGFCISNSKYNKVFYIDPYQLARTEPKADVLLITHGHYDHCSITDMNKIVKDGTLIFCTADCQSAITKLDKRVNMQTVEPGQELKLNDIKIAVVPAYNTKKIFHPRSENLVGYVITFGNVTIYHAGDTDLIKEMEKLTGYGKEGQKFIVLLPVGGKFTMNAEEAAKAASLIKPTLAVPIHWGGIIGSNEDANSFCNICESFGIEAKILEKVN